MMVFSLADTPAWLRAAIDAFRGHRVMDAPQSRATNRLRGSGGGGSRWPLR